MRSHSLCLALAIVLLLPSASAQWVPTGGLGGGDIASVASNESMTSAATFNGVFRTSDAASPRDFDDGAAEYVQTTGLALVRGSGNGFLSSAVKSDPEI